VDDDYEIVDSMKIVLESKGYEVLVARDGNQGLAMAEREDPDLVILDMMMPKRSGFLVLEKLRRTRDVPVRVIMITANEGSRHKAYAEMLGVDDYIRKPFPMDRLIESVKRLVG
jgi:DNA-binding response OmpR family regulator